MSRSQPKTEPPKKFLARREQRGIMLMALLLGVVVLMMIKAADPDTWSFMGFDEDSPAAESEPKTNKRGEVELDTDYYTPTVTEDPEGTIYTVPEREREWIASGSDRYPGVDLAALSLVKDNRPMNRSAEAPAFYNLLFVLQENFADYLEKLSEAEVTFVQMMEQPTAYRGRLVTSTGRVRKAEKQKLRKNQYGLTDYYRLVLEMDEGLQTGRPMYVYSLELPETFPLGEELRENIRFTGFYYKNTIYEKAGDGQTALIPVVLAKRFHWLQEAPKEVVPTEKYLTWGGVIALSVMVICWLAVRRARSNSKSSYEQLRGLPAEEKVIEVAAADLAPSVGDQLQEMTDNE